MPASNGQLEIMDFGVTGMTIKAIASGRIATSV
jgi:hypothetical protein